MVGSEGIVVGKAGNVVAGSGGRVNLGAVGRFGSVGFGRDGIWLPGKDGICVVGFGRVGNGGSALGIGSGGKPLGIGIEGIEVCNRCLAAKLMLMLDKHNAATMIDNREQRLRPAILVKT
ncbi:protein argonaute 3-like [Argentina anserina]|uniref:protein argonaute 3-like n=1 Tax=Argentina anserina TaxID=57926 RepID=UPI0021764874|nr:protein argonaute 3-like [Potentilla anserina]